MGRASGRGRGGGAEGAVGRSAMIAEAGIRLLVATSRRIGVARAAVGASASPGGSDRTLDRGDSGRRQSDMFTVASPWSRSPVFRRVGRWYASHRTQGH